MILSSHNTLFLAQLDNQRCNYKETSARQREIKVAGLFRTLILVNHVACGALLALARRWSSCLGIFSIQPVNSATNKLYYFVHVVCVNQDCFITYFFNFYSQATFNLLPGFDETCLSFRTQDLNLVISIVIYYV